LSTGNLRVIVHGSSVRDVQERSASIRDGGSEAARGAATADCVSTGGELPEALSGVDRYI
jgi:hypothetical protein